MRKFTRVSSLLRPSSHPDNRPSPLPESLNSWPSELDNFVEESAPSWDQPSTLIHHLSSEHDPYAPTSSSQPRRSTLTDVTGSRNSPSAPSQTTLEWNDHVEGIAIRSSHAHAADYLDPVGSPPEYETARIPPHQVTYTFSQLGAPNTGLLLPPASSPDTRPLYYISVCNHFLAPNVIVSSLFKGTSADGDYVGGFTTVLPVYHYQEYLQALSEVQTVSIGKHELPLSWVLEMSHVHSKYIIRWRPQKPNKCLVWTCIGWPLPAKGTIECSHHSFPNVTLATYSPNKRLPDRVRAPLEPVLTITPDGHRHLDEIVLSLLLVERERMSFRIAPKRLQEG